MDFFQIAVKERKGGVLEVYPDFVVGRVEDLMVRGKSFYAVWDEEAGLWSTDEFDVARIVDQELKAFAEKNPHVGVVKYMRNFSSNSQSLFRKYLREISDNSHQLDENLTFSDTEVKKKDYVSKRLPYALAPGDISAWNEIAGTLYKPEQRAKIEWAIGSIVSGDSKTNQKFLVLYGPPGAGKGTMIDIVSDMFVGYTTTFDAKSLGSGANQFAAAAFVNQPLVAFQHDGDLSRIEDNTLLNMIVSHESMRMNEKHKPAYDTRIKAFLIMGTNKAVKITDAQSGLIRRLIDVHPSGTKVPHTRYHMLKDRIAFELGAIAYHCLQVYKEMSKNYYSNYRPTEMMFKTNAFVNFIDANYDLFKKQNGVSVRQAWTLFKEYQEEANLGSKMSMHAFKSELGNYFEEYEERHIMEDGTEVRSWYSGFTSKPFTQPDDDDAGKPILRLDSTTSLLDLEYADYPAQYSNDAGVPRQRWMNVKTTLAEIDTSKEHYVNGFPEDQIVIDFDKTDANGEKSLEINLAAAASWPSTYAEISRSGKAVHLHYKYDGDVTRLAKEFEPGVEIKVYTGNTALRRKLTLCNEVPIATISGGLPLKEKQRVIEPGTMKTEKALRDLIGRNLRKEIHPGTKSSIDFIKKILDDAHEDGLRYDVSDMRGRITAFANNSSNQALTCLKTVQSMRWKSMDDELPPEEQPTPREERLVFFDIEVYPNLLVICWKFEEDNPTADHVTRMINPSPQQVEALFSFKLVGFNVRQYDNHILWAAAMGFSNAQLYQLSTKIIQGAVGAKFGEAYKLSYTDIYDYSTKKQGLKKWQIELGLEHREMDIPWDQPVKDEDVMRVVEYCVNDVVSEELVHKHLQGDWTARKILADLSGLTPNDTTAKHTAAIIFGRDKNPQRSFVYTDLSKEFPGYEYKLGKSTYRDELVGEGGYVYAEPGVYRNVALLDVASMHPTSIGQLNLFGSDYTPRFMALVEAQLAIKRGNYDVAKEMLDGKLVPYIQEIERLASTDPAAAKKAAAELRYGLKISINIVYGLTSAKFDNPFRDLRNVDNIVAKRGALFMVELKHQLQQMGAKVVHIKTDSVKLADATDEQIAFVMQFGEKYGYTFEHEADYDRFGLVNDAVYLAHYDDESEVNRKNGKSGWTATGAQFQHPYVFKKLFGYSDQISFLDLRETKHVQQGALYLDFGIHDEVEGDPAVGYMDSAALDIKAAEKAEKQKTTDWELQKKQAQESYDDALMRLIHVGKTGQFTPVLPGYGGGQLWRIKDGRHYAVQGTKGHLWMDSTLAANLPDEAIDYSYFDKLLETGRETLSAFIGEEKPFATLEAFLS